MAYLLTAASTIMCPHGGQVSVAATNSRVTLGGAKIALATDTFTVGGCPFVVGTSPHPCMTVEWQLTAQRSTCDGAATLTTDSVGMCKAADGAVQGTAMIAATQTRAAGT
jgi:hypothetical protein